MALEIPRFLQTKTYSAKALRAILLDGDIQPGVVGASDFMVVQRAAGANLSVDVGAGAGWVKGSSTARQGLYDIYNDAVLNVGVATANGTNPRIDQIVARIYDTTDGGSAQDIATVEVVTGTATAGATLANRTGAAALPAHTLLLADVLVAASATTITSANIRDRRPWARGFKRTVLGTTVAPTTTSASPALLPEMTVTGEFSGVQVDIDLNCMFSHNTGAYIDFLLQVDGATPPGYTAEQSYRTMAGVGTGGMTTSGMWAVVPTAGRHTFSVSWATGGGTATSYSTRRALRVREDVRQISELT